jgi:hypothetical protein
LLFNLFVLKDFGPSVERLIGSGLFLIGYLFSGFCGSLASVCCAPAHVSAGASGAIFGLFGIVLGLLTRYRNAIPAEFVKRHKNMALFFVGYNVFLSFNLKGIDLAAHLGGLGGGFLFGLLINPVFAVDFSGVRRRQWVALTAAACLVSGFAGFQALAYPVSDVPGAIAHVFVVESEVVKALLTIHREQVESSITAKEAADEIRQKVVAPWMNARKELEALPHVLPQHQNWYDAVCKFMQLREESWMLIADGAEHDDLAKQGEGQLKLEAAFDVLRNWANTAGIKSQVVPDIPAEFAIEFAVYLAIEQRVASELNTAFQTAGPQPTEQSELANRIERLVSELRAAQKRFMQRGTTARDANPKLAALVIRYALTNEQRLDAQAVALRTQDEQSAEQLRQKEMEFERAGEELKRALSGKNGISPEPK